jgi:predicted dehydrogenase
LRYRLAIIGCGAVFDQFQLPALKKLKQIPSFFIDLNIDAAKRYANKFKSDTDTNYENVMDDFDAAIVSVPHYLHAPICKKLLENHKHVFVEKPFVTTRKDGIELVKLANEVDKTICVGNFRRYKKSTIWVKELVKSKLLGDIQEFHFREGGISGWPATTDSFWDKRKACGGVLMDTGAHTIDQLCFMLGAAADVIEYKDDAQGGVEANCFIGLELENGTRGSVELSRTRNLGSSAYIKGSKGSLVTDLVGGEIQTNPKDLVLKKYNNIIGNKVKAEPYVDLFVKQLSAWFNAIENRSVNYVKGSDVLPSIKIIDNCYSNKKEMNYNWI